MRELLTSFNTIVSRRDSRNIIIVTTVFLFLFLLFVQNGGVAIKSFSFNVLPFYKRLAIFFSTFFDIKNTFTTSTLILATLGSLLGGINVSLAYTYMKIRGQLIIKSGIYSGLGLFFALLGIGCVACGTAFISLVLGFFGFSTMLNILPYQGQEIGYIGIIILCIATYALSKKLSEPNVC